MGVLEPREQIEPDCSQVAALKGTTAQRDRKNSYRQCCTPLKSRKKKSHDISSFNNHKIIRNKNIQNITGYLPARCVIS